MGVVIALMRSPSSSPFCSWRGAYSGTRRCWCEKARTPATNVSSSISNFSKPSWSDHNPDPYLRSRRSNLPCLQDLVSPIVHRHFLFRQAHVPFLPCVAHPPSARWRASVPPRGRKLVCSSRRSVCGLRPALLKDSGIGIRIWCISTAVFPPRDTNAWDAEYRHWARTAESRQGGCIFEKRGAYRFGFLSC